MVENECDAVRDILIARWDWSPGGEDEMRWSSSCCSGRCLHKNWVVFNAAGGEERELCQ